MSPDGITAIDYQHPRGLSRQVVAKLAKGAWIARAHNVVVTGPPGVGKTFVANALAAEAARAGHTVTRRRVPRLLYELAHARRIGTYPEVLAELAAAELLVLDDWGLTALTNVERRDVLEVVEDRDGKRATLVTSQLPTSAWRDYVGDPVVADALLDRLLANAHVLELRGASLRRQRACRGAGKRKLALTATMSLEHG